jgi:hypothetical protein
MCWLNRSKPDLVDLSYHDRVYQSKNLKNNTTTLTSWIIVVLLDEFNSQANQFNEHNALAR